MNMKKISNLLFLLIACLVAGCSSDGEDNSDFRWTKNGSVKDFIGTLRYNSDIGKWGLYPDEAFNNPFLSQGEFENSAFVIIDNMSEEIEKYQNKVVITNGDYEWVSDETYNPDFDAVLKLYTIHITGIRLYSPNN